MFWPKIKFKYRVCFFLINLVIGIYEELYKFVIMYLYFYDHHITTDKIFRNHSFNMGKCISFVNQKASPPLNITAFLSQGLNFHHLYQCSRSFMTNIMTKREIIGLKIYFLVLDLFLYCYLFFFFLLSGELRFTCIFAEIVEIVRNTDTFSYH